MTTCDNLRRLHFINALFAGLTGNDLYVQRRRRPAARTAVRRPAGPWVLSLERRGILRRRHATLCPRKCAGGPQEPRALSRIHPARDQSPARALPAQPPLDEPAPARVRRVACAHPRPGRRPQPPQCQPQSPISVIFHFTGGNGGNREGHAFSVSQSGWSYGNDYRRSH